MAQFKCKAVDPGGNLVTRLIDAESENGAQRILSGLNLSPVYIAQQSDSIWSRDLALPGSSRTDVSGKSLREFAASMATLLASKVELATAVRLAADAVSEKSGKAFFVNVADRLQGGAALSGAMGDEGGSAVPVYIVSLIRAGEKGGCLEDIFQSLAASLKSREDYRRRIRSALIYPILLLILATLSILFLSLVVIPRFEPIFHQAGAELPAITAFFLALS